MRDCLNDITGIMTGLGAILAIIGGIFSKFLSLIKQIESNYYVKTKNNSIFDSNENQSDKRTKQYYSTRNSFSFSEEEEK